MIKGIGVSDGIGIGTAVVICRQQTSYAEHAADPAAEKARLAKATEAFCQTTEELAAELGRTAGEKESEILLGHIRMVQDPFWVQQLEERLTTGSSAEAAVDFVCEMFISMFDSTGDELTMQRAADVRDIRQRLFAILTDAQPPDLSVLPQGSVLVADDLTPSMTARIDKNAISGIITQTGGRTSHSAILARALRIPAVLQAEGATERIKSGDRVALDGSTGEIFLSPNETQLANLTEKKSAQNALARELCAYIGKPTQTADGHMAELFANIGTPGELPAVLENDCEGIGLFRTEFLFMDRDKAPTLEEQFAAYKQVVSAMEGKPVIIRTLDIGGDKEVPYLGLPKEENPFLGFRAVRYCLKNETLYRKQLKALVMASHYGDLRVMIPLVTTLSEVRAVKAMIRSVQEECRSGDIPFCETMKIGVMIETPAACMMADRLAGEVDFFSIGTNDLTQYIMAADRGNPEAAYLYSACNPAVLRSIERIIACAHEAGIPAGMCGEAAADTRLVPLWLSYGLDEFSVSAPSALSVRRAISLWNMAQAHEVAAHVRTLCTAEETEAYLESVERK